MDTSPDLLRAFLMGIRMTMQAYRLVEPSVGENKTLGILFEVAASNGPTKFDQRLAQRIVNVIQEAVPSGATHSVTSIPVANAIGR